MKTKLSDKEFISIVEQCQTMAYASKMTGMSFSSFKRRAQQLGVYKTNQGGKGTSKVWNTSDIKTEDILAGKYPHYQTYKLKLRLLKEGYFEDKCSICGWNKKPEGSEFTPCELDHINRKSN